MANRVPLIVDTTNLHLKELPLGDALDLTGCGIVGLSSFTPGTGGGFRFVGVTTFGMGVGIATVFVNDGLIANYLRATNLTDNRVVTAGAGGTLTDSSDLTYDGTTLGVTGAITASTNLTVTGNAVVNGNVDLGNAATDSITPTGRFDAHIIPLTDGDYDLGASGVEFKDLYIDGTANIDALVADTAKISDISDNHVVIGGSAGELEGSSSLTFDGSTLTVTGDLAVSGNLNYTNVTDIYSVGIITAAANVQVGAGVSVVGVSTFTGTQAGVAHTCLKLTNLGTTDGSAVRITHVMKDDGNNLRDAGYINMIADDTNQSGEDSSIDFWTTKAGTTARHTKLFAGDSHGGRGLGIGTAGVVRSGILNSRATLDVDGCVHIEGYSNQVGVGTFNNDVNFVGDAVGVITCTWDASARSLIFNDNSKAIFGTGSDLEIFHNPTGNLSTIYNSHANGLAVRSNVIMLQNAAGDHDYLTTEDEKGVTLFYDNGARLATTNDGAFITGIATVSSTSHIRIPVGNTSQRPGVSIVVDGDIRYNNQTNTYEGYGNGAWGGLGGGTEIDNKIATASATGVGTFAKASYRSASIRAQIDQGGSYQVGRYLLIHDGTTVTVVEEAAIATGSMLGSFDGVIAGSNVEFKVTMVSAGIATVTTIIDKISV